ncbi:MAG TPA: UPF0280 family protein [Syntrophales bacterium]|nr:UPF0280 family protein [Syntrophales bacterium]HOM07061.1 UPF0280 family protein [Syntrophales bacterium]HON98902.1 UPF0280 family protein [Syntrophales bacterium]HPC00366.1 UPF0280 family protein [Syntrophales bacterium]HPQ06570.1 UPF0280 family protein [Syntrophales bacterium]
MDLSADYKERTYRRLTAPEGLFTFETRVKETDLFVAASRDLRQRALDAILFHRRHLESYIALHRDFLTSFTPVPFDPLAPEIARVMMKAAAAAGVGPMASVAGAVAEFVGRDLRMEAEEVIVENGGDIYIDCRRGVTVGIFAGKSPLSGRVAIDIEPDRMPLGVCTSSATVGPSVSFGKADAVCILSPSAALADAAASAVGNVVQSPRDVRGALGLAQGIKGVTGAVIVIGETLGVWGDVVLRQ